MKATLTVYGGDDLTKRLAKLGPAISRPVKEGALREAAEPIRAAAEAQAPRGDAAPHMADNIIVDVLSEAEIARSADYVAEDVVAEIGPAKNFFYGAFQEFGTVRQPARPWFRPAWDANWRRAQAIIGSATWNAIRRLGGSR